MYLEESQGQQQVFKLLQDVMNIVKQFKSVASFVSYLDEGKTQPSFSEESKLNDFEFTGTKSYVIANNLCKYGDEESRKLLMDAGETLTPSFSYVKKTKMDKTGYLPMVGAYLTGRPNCMKRRVRQYVPKRVISVVYNACAPWYVEKADMALASAKLLSAILRIENSGVRVNLYLSDIGQDAGDDVGFIVKVKDSGQRLNILTMAYPMIHPSMHRRHFFRFLEVTEGVNPEFRYGYGRPVKETSTMQRVLRKADIKCDACISMMELVEKKHISVDEIIKMIDERHGGTNNNPHR